MNGRFPLFLPVLAVIAFACMAQSCATTDTATHAARNGAAPGADGNAPAPESAPKKNNSPVGKEYYTAANIWYKHPREIWSLNHHRGAMLPAGTRVTIRSISGRGIAFVDQGGTAYRLLLARKYAAPGFTANDLFGQYFTATDPLGKDGVFPRLTEVEKHGVKTGRIAAGMSKQAVLMAYGYPPTHITPSTESDVWKYWASRFRAYLVYFRNDRVAEIKEDL